MLPKFSYPLKKFWIRAVVENKSFSLIWKIKGLGFMEGCWSDNGYAALCFKRDDGYEIRLKNTRAGESIMIIYNQKKKNRHISTTLQPSTDEEFDTLFKLIGVKKYVSAKE